MSIIAKVPTGSNFKQIPAGTHVATLAKVEDLGMRPNQFKKDSEGNPTMQHQVCLHFELEGYEGSDLRSWVTLSLFKKANLFKIVRCLIGAAPNEDLDLLTVVGRQCLVEVEHKPGKDNKVWPRIVDYHPNRTNVMTNTHGVEVSDEDLGI